MEVRHTEVRTDEEDLHPLDSCEAVRDEREADGGADDRMRRAHWHAERCGRDQERGAAHQRGELPERQHVCWSSYSSTDTIPFRIVSDTFAPVELALNN